MPGAIIDVPPSDCGLSMREYYRAWRALGATAEDWRRVRELTDHGATQDEAFTALRVAQVLAAI